MTAQPSGTVTFLFTDIEGSTRLLQELGPEEYQRALGEHRRLLREAFEGHGGYEVDYEGDAFFVAFQSAQEAVAAAAQGQAALASGAVRVRIGIHTGEALLDPPKYVGMAVHQAARIMSAGHGGQVVVSQATRELVETELRDLGEHRLKDLGRPVRLYQLGGEEFPPLKTLHQTNLPVPATPFLGREQELAEVLDRLRASRLLTLTGPGGTGKTRLALQAAAEAADDYPQGVWWVPLAPLRDPGLVIPQAAQTLGAKGELAEHVGGSRLLLLLDNFEQVVEASAQLSALLSGCPNLTLLVTSRERLQLAGEQEWAVPTLVSADALALFRERARALGIELPTNGAVCELCARLDNLPLALELAAARTKLFSPEQLLERLGQRLDLLKGGRDADPRQQTLRATIRWSYDLLALPEQRLFAQLSVFAGGCTLEAAEQICEADAETLASLLDKSLVRKREDRFWMLESIREFAAERLEAAPEAEEIRRRHADWYVALGGRLREPFRKGDEAATAAMSAELDNFRLALEWAAGSDEPAHVASLVWALWYFWGTRALVEEGLRWSHWVISESERIPAEQRAYGLTGASELIRFFGDAELALRIKQDVLPILQELGDESRAAATLSDLAGLKAERGDLSEARALAERALELRRSLGDSALIGHALSYRAQIEFRAGDFDRARSLYEESLPLCEAGGSSIDAAGAVLMIAECAQRLGDSRGARRELSRALGLLLALGQRIVFPELLQEAAALAGDPETAAILLAAGNRLEEELGVPRWDAADVERTTAILRDRLGPDAFEAACRRGRLLSEEDALALARDYLG